MRHILALILSAVLAACFVPVESMDDPGMEEEHVALGPPIVNTCYAVDHRGHVGGQGHTYPGGCCVDGCLKKEFGVLTCVDGMSAATCGSGGDVCEQCSNGHFGCAYSTCQNGLFCGDTIKAPGGNPCFGAGWFCDGEGNCCPGPGIPGTCK